MTVQIPQTEGELYDRLKAARDEVTTLAGVVHDGEAFALLLAAGEKIEAAIRQWVGFNDDEPRVKL